MSEEVARVWLEWLWAGVGAFFLAEAIGKRKRRILARTASSSSAVTRALLAFGAGALFFPDVFGPDRLLSKSHLVTAVGCTAACAGLLLMLWSRVALAEDWSGEASIAEGHRLVDSGPYCVVRHPIYSGVLLAALGTMLVQNSVLALAGFLLLCIAFGRKITSEEHLLSEHFGESFLRYQQRVKAVVPFLL